MAAPKFTGGAATAGAKLFSAFIVFAVPKAGPTFCIGAAP